MLVESNDLLTAANAAQTAGIGLPRLNELMQSGQIRPFVAIDGVRFFHRAEVLALRTFLATMAGKRPTVPLPRMHELF